MTKLKRPLVDDNFRFGITPDTGVEKTQRVIPDGDILAGRDMRLSRINAPSGFTSSGTYTRITGTAQSATSTTITLASGHAFADNALAGAIIYILKGTGAHQSKTIISNTLADDVCTISSGATNWSVTPDSTSVYEIKAFTQVTVGNAYVTTEDAASNGSTGGAVEDIEVNLGTAGTGWLTENVASSQGGVYLKSQDAKVVRARVARTLGTAAKLTFGTTGQTNYYVHNRMLIRDSELLGCHNGVETTVPDTWIYGNMIVSYRDYGLWVAAGDTAVQSAANHIYGSGPYGMGMYINAGEFTSTGDKVDDSWVGVWCTGNAFNSQFTGLFSQKCWHRNVFCAAKVKFVGGRISTITDSAQHSGIVGVEITGSGVELSGIRHDINWVTYDGHTSPSANDGAIKINSGANRLVIDNYWISSNSASYQDNIGIHIAGETIGSRIVLIADGFNNTGDVGIKIDDPSYIKGCDITVYGTHASGKLITVGAGWASSNTIRTVTSAGTATTVAAGTALT